MTMRLVILFTQHSYCSTRPIIFFLKLSTLFYACKIVNFNGESKIMGRMKQNRCTMDKGGMIEGIGIGTSWDMDKLGDKIE